MPIATVACQPGRVQAQDRADLARAQSRDEPLEAWPCHRAASGAAQIVIDHVDVVKALGVSDLDQIVLAS
ncbi:MAG: hypothetical protein QG601_1899, partial [Pseudomonadota bacterium]|nr:hypothetical protein [Pseudomonadota bacterium]